MKKLYAFIIIVLCTLASYEVLTRVGGGRGGRGRGDGGRGRGGFHSGGRRGGRGFHGGGRRFHGGGRYRGGRGRGWRRGYGYGPVIGLYGGYYDDDYYSEPEYVTTEVITQPAPSDQYSTSKDLEEQIDDLRRQNRRLRDRLEELEERLSKPAT